MNKEELWIKAVEQKGDICSRHILTNNEFATFCHQILDDPRCPLTGFRLKVECSPLGNVVVDLGIDGKLSSSKTIPLGDSGGSSCSIELWLNGGIDTSHQAGVIESCNDVLKQMVESHWKPNLRDDKTNLPSLHITQTKSLVNETITKNISCGTSLAIFYIDLDKFKSVNDEYGQAIGDKLILHMAGLLVEAVGDRGIPLHVGGDEFSLLFPITNYDEPLYIAYELATLAKRKAFHVDTGDDIALSFGMGIAIAAGLDSPRTFDTLFGYAENAAKPGGQKMRGTARFYVPNALSFSGENTEFNRNAALAVVKSQIVNKRPFANPWLNLASQLVYNLVNDSGLVPSEVSDFCKDFLEWAKPSFDTNIVSAARTGSDLHEMAPSYSPFDFMMAIAHGIYRSSALNGGQIVAGKSLTIQHDSTWNKLLLVINPEHGILIDIHGVGTDIQDWELGEFWSINEGDDCSKIPGAIAVLVKIGHSKLNIARSIFSDIIVLDDRPTRGGGLPDFSHAAIARLIAAVEKNPNVDIAYVIGDRQNGVKTITALEDIQNWPKTAEHLSVKMAVTPKSIIQVSKQLNGQVFIFDSEEELIADLAAKLRLHKALTSINKHVGPATQIFLKRELIIDEMRLKKEDGCRVGTAAEAYPTVLEIARNSEDEPLITDQAGQELRELDDFKVHLTNPKKDKIPAFYIDDAEEFENYFQQVFIQDTGLFAAPLRASNQLECVLGHLAEILTLPTERRFATRRAILVVPHVVTGEADVAPLGLVSIRILPRFEDNVAILHYSYTWRTVEALVGFPFSLYGSIRFSEYLTDQLVKKVSPPRQDMLQMGVLSYVAHSLHMFVDDYGQNIARRIVNDATK